MKLVIVESPTKAKTISKFLGRGYKVESSFGHIRDLPKSKMGIDIENNFIPQYVTPRDKSKRANELKKLAQKADGILFATDEDREGEAISWHLANLFKIDPLNAQRITFHEITKNAILAALENPKALDIHLVNAQQARRILDRLVGYELSPFLWKKVTKGLSAGRVQSVAVRLIVEREREIQNFKQEEYWSIESDFAKKNQNELFPAKLFKVNGKTLKKQEIQNKEQADALLEKIQAAKQFHVLEIEKKEKKKYPTPPFITSTLQQQANNKFNFSAKQTMVLAQQLYEGIKLGDQGAIGLITYMRTDSTNLSAEFITETHEYIKNTFGEKYSLTSPRVFKKKAKGAQEAHEAIRPTSILRTPESVHSYLDEKQYKLYTLIWQRACASQMQEAVMNQTSALICEESQTYIFKANGNIIAFDGYLKVYSTETKETLLPHLEKTEELDLKNLSGEQHFTQPPARYTEASLVKVLEENGIGRPSTYAPTIATIQARNYVTKEQKQLAPTEIAFLVNDLLVEHFPEIIDYEFTAKMENNLDEIAEGKLSWQPMIKDFYDPFKKNLEKKYEEVNKKELTEEAIDEKCEKCGSGMVIKIGRFGKFVACTNYPECKNTKNLGYSETDGKTGSNELYEQCPQCGNKLEYKHGRYGKFVGCSNYPECKFIRSNQEKIGVKCPKCGKGEIVGKKSRYGKIFYACDQYPQCENAYWGKPTGDTCPKCSAMLIEKKDTVVCSNKECTKK
mgnify:CR=1 FL=1